MSDGTKEIGAARDMDVRDEVDRDLRPRGGMQQNEDREEI
jgi:hypothetical protein